MVADVADVSLCCLEGGAEARMIGGTGARALG